MKWFRGLFGGATTKRKREGYRNPLSGLECLGAGWVPRSVVRSGYHNPLSALERLEDRVVPATLTWNYNGPFTGNWHSAGNWTASVGAPHVPTLADDVVIPAGTGSIGLTGNAECMALVVSPGYGNTFNLNTFTLKIDVGPSGGNASSISGGP